MATANNIRKTGLELEEGVTALKAAADALDTTISGWELRGLDGALPTDVEMKQALADYDAIQKQTIGMNDDLAAIRAVVIP